MPPPDRLDDLRRFLEDLANLTRRYGLELTSDATDGLAIRDQEHDVVLARDGAFEQRAGYQFDIEHVTADPYPEVDGRT